jgi:uncharacterized membrane protein YdjX (TVP38/TMEM64 family)
MTVETKPAQEKPPLPPEIDPPQVEPGPSWKKIAILAIGAGILLTVIYLSPLRAYLGHWHEVSQGIRSFGALAPLVLTLSVAVLVAVGFPRLVFCVIAGMALGFWSGLLWAQLGTLLGNYALFVVARAGGRDWMQRVLSKRAHLRNTIQQRGALGVILARQVPLPGLVINLTCALLPIRHVDFIVGTIIGQLPQAIPCTLIGAGVLQPSFKKSVGLIGLAVIVSILIWLVLRYALRRGRAEPPKPPTL